MKSLTIRHFTVFLMLTFIAESSVAFNCDTTLIANDPSQDYSDQVYLADCRIEMQESSPFIISPGHQAQLTAEQQIRLGPGFHAQSGSYFHAKLRDCIRNPDKNTGYASYGEPNPPPDDQWIPDIAKAFVDNFNDQYGLTVELKYDGGTASDIADLYRDSTQVAAGNDDDDSPLKGIDKGVFFFHAGHGGSSVWGPRGRDGTRLEWADMRLGNCSSDGIATGELRYLFVCSCRSFAHGPRRLDGTHTRWEYPRPSDFDPNFNPTNPVNTSSLPNDASVFDRLGPVLTENMRMACGASTTAHCNVNDPVDSVVYHMKQNYFEYLYNVADSWGYANARYNRGDFRQTPLCIARGNLNGDDIRSPITDDQIFTEKANPYDEALHVKSWETVVKSATFWDDVTEHEDVIIGKSSIINERLFAQKVINPYVKVSNVVSREDIKKTTASLEEQLHKLPVFLTEPSSPTWFAEESKILRDEKYIKTQELPDEFNVVNDTLISKKTTKNGRPRIRVNTRTGVVILSGNRKPVSVSEKGTTLSLKKYAIIVKSFIDKHGWSENDVGDISVVSGMLQVKPLDSKIDASTLLKVQNEITFFVGRRILLENVSPRVLGSDNQIVVQLNNDGSINSASKSWRKITQKIEGIPVKSYKKAYAEAVNQLGNPGLYKLSTWDWGYKSTTDNSGQEMMVVYYVFTFEPLSIVNACIDIPRVIKIRGHIM